MIKEIMNEKIDAKGYSPLALAYIGDCIFELLVRTMLVKKENKQVYKYHKEAVKYVKASAQASISKSIEHMLSEEEIAVFKRGRNSKSKPPKNADTLEYKYATGFEALIGYLYLKGDMERIYKIVDEGIKELDV
ncbi:MAG: ribonuclease III [Clostridia bacterium]|jgi:ribonuclease-3 family protein|nr:ribonuclease III [Clostridia bacterium]